MYLQCLDRVWNEDETVAFRVGVGSDNAQSVKHRKPFSRWVFWVNANQGLGDYQWTFRHCVPFREPINCDQALLRY